MSMFPGVLNEPPPCKPDEAPDVEEEEPIEVEVAEAELDEDAPDADVVDVAGGNVV
jgi:hypothetical protein